MTSLDKVSDEELESAFQKRFRVSVGEAIKGSDHVAKHLMTYLGGRLTRECFVVVFLNNRNQILSTEILFEGTLTSSAVYPREIIKRIVELNAAAIIISHNHPSGNLTASTDDIKITKKIKEACQTIDVNLHDHVIITPGGGYTSMADQGLM